MDTNNLTLTQNQALNMIKAVMEISQLKSLKLNRAVELFLQIKKVNGSRDATLKYYKDIFITIRKYLESINVFETSEITNDVIFQYTDHLFRKGVTKCYINKVCGALIHLNKLLSEHNYVAYYNYSFKKMKEEHKEIKILSDEQLEKIVMYIKDKPLIQNIAFRMFLETGIRRTELIKIETKNINLKENKIYLTHTKNHDSRYIFISDTTKILIEELLVKYDNIDYLFWNFEKQTPLSTSFVDSLFLRTKKDLDFINLSPHLLRHTFCTALARSNIDFKSLQKLMGHKTVQITLQYIELINQESLAEVSLSNNPIANF